MKKFNDSDQESGIKLFQRYKKRIIKVYNKIHSAFTLTDFIKTYSNFRHITELASNCTKKVKSLKLRLYQNFFNSCFFLLITYLTFKNKKTKEISDIPINNITLNLIIFLNLKIHNEKYSPY